LHNVRHCGAAIHNDPFAILFALDARLGEARLTHGIAHTGREGLGLPIGCTGSHNDPLEKRREVLGVEHLRHVLGFDVFQAIDDGALEFLDVFLGGRFQWSSRLLG
jgi:hypothetical protein